MRNGKITKNIKIKNSTIYIIPKSPTEIIIINVLTKIPIPTEKPTKPFLYSFFRGLKKVLTRVEKEKKRRYAPFKEKKNLKRPSGASKNQNLAINTGRASNSTI